MKVQWVFINLRIGINFHTNNSNNIKFSAIKWNLYPRLHYFCIDLVSSIPKFIIDVMDFHKRITDKWKFYFRFNIAFICLIWIQLSSYSVHSFCLDVGNSYAIHWYNMTGWRNIIGNKRRCCLLLLKYYLSRQYKMEILCFNFKNFWPSYDYFHLRIIVLIQIIQVPVNGQLKRGLYL